MKVLLVYAHPEPKSLNGSLRDFTVKRLEQAGHVVQVSEIYAMKWKASLDAGDSRERLSAERFYPSRESKHALEKGRAKRGHRSRAGQPHVGGRSDPAISDVVVLDAGHFSRLGGAGLCVRLRIRRRRALRRALGERYREGKFAGKRAMLIVTTGGWESHYSARGINGPMDDVLFPIQHGILYYPGFDVVPPFVVYRTSKIDETNYAQVRDALGQRLDDLWTTATIPFRQQNGGAYAIPQLTLRDEFAPEQVDLPRTLNRLCGVPVTLC